MTTLPISSVPATLLVDEDVRDRRRGSRRRRFAAAMNEPFIAPPAPEVAAARRARLLALARLMDNALVIPGTGIRLGLDPLIGLIPAAGDAITGVVSLYIVAEAARLGATHKQIALMLANVAIDTLVGAVPGLGDVFDVAFKANTRNLAIMGIVAKSPV